MAKYAHYLKNVIYKIDNNSADTSGNVVEIIEPNQKSILPNAPYISIVFYRENAVDGRIELGEEYGEELASATSLSYVISLSNSIKVGDLCYPLNEKDEIINVFVCHSALQEGVIDGAHRTNSYFDLYRITEENKMLSNLQNNQTSQIPFFLQFGVNNGKANGYVDFKDINEASRYGLKSAGQWLFEVELHNVYYEVVSADNSGNPIVKHVLEDNDKFDITNGIKNMILESAQQIASLDPSNDYSISFTNTAEVKEYVESKKGEYNNGELDCTDFYESICSILNINITE